MDTQTLLLINEIDRAIIKLRGVYSAWAGAHGISYNELLVFYAIRENGWCTQKQICDKYLIPRQTMNNVITRLHRSGILELSKFYSCGREKAFVLTEEGERYARKLLGALGALEGGAVEQMGEEKLRTMTTLLVEYESLLGRLMEREN